MTNKHIELVKKWLAGERVRGDVGDDVSGAVIRKMYREKCEQVEKLERQLMDALNRCHHVITGETSPLDDILYIQEVLIADNKSN